ncbi:MAG: helix-turn-helix transcriptional regulator [Candidatus Uhrbacteria bacterium]
MKNRKIKKFNIDPLAEIKKSKNYSLYAKDADDRIRLATAVYNKRVELGLSQQKLAKLAKTTQKVVSNIENADMNPGFNLLNRIEEALQFQAKDWAKVHSFIIPSLVIPVSLSSRNTGTAGDKQLSSEKGLDKQNILNVKNDFISN